MKSILAAIFFLSACVLIESVNHHKSINSEDEEIIYRITRSTHGMRKDGECRYKKGPWSECDSNNVQKKTLNLKKGDSSCEESKVITRKCKKSCKYDKGDWSECETSTNTRTRTDNLKPKSDSSCQPTRTLSKKCKKVCKYNKQAPWSDCDATTGKKTKTLVLKNGNPQLCEESKKITKPCYKAAGHGHKKNKDDYDEDE